jgi:hypothetical protein
MSLSMFFILALIGGYLLNKSYYISNGKWQESTSSSIIHCLTGASGQPMVEGLYE